MAVYDFSVGVFRSEYPAFVDETKYPDTMITTAFTSAETYFHNDDASIYPYDPPHNYFRKYLLDRATCHLLYMASLPSPPSLASRFLKMRSRALFFLL